MSASLGLVPAFTTDVRMNSSDCPEIRGSAKKFWTKKETKEGTNGVGPARQIIVSSVKCKASLELEGLVYCRNLYMTGRLLLRESKQARSFSCTNEIPRVVSFSERER